MSNEAANIFEVALLEFSMGCRIAAPILTDVVLTLGEKAYIDAGSPSPPVTGATAVTRIEQVPLEVSISAIELNEVIQIPIFHPASHPFYFFFNFFFPIF